MIVDEEPPLPVPGALLRQVGIRIRGHLHVVDDDTPDGVLDLEYGEAPPGDRQYALTGVAGQARDVEASFGRGDGRHVGAELVLTVGGVGFQVHVDGFAAEHPTPGRATARGTLSLVGDYEWEAFALEDTRTEWTVKEVMPVDGGDVMVDLEHTR